jgi:pimeloyl-ACP methyl ester carboxylesterase
MEPGNTRPKQPTPLADVRGASRLVIDLTLLVTGLVETMHHNIARRPGILGRATHAPTTGITGLVYRSVRGITRLVGGTIDVVLAPLVPLLAVEEHWPGRDVVIAALNGVLGDRLAASGNPLALSMQFVIGGVPLDLDSAALAGLPAAPRERIVVLVHGLCMNEGQWKRGGHDHGKSLARDFDASAVYLRYNSGLHVSINGAEFARQLETLVALWPVPVREVVLVGHSMGGLVIRSAFAVAEAGGHAWPRLVRALVFLGSPHHGAPLERGGHGVDRLLAASPYTVAFTRLGHLRSAGITDLRHGSVQDADRAGHGRFDHAADRRAPLPLPAGVPCYAIAASLDVEKADRRRKPRGDELVPLASALGHHRDPRMDLGIPADRQWIAWGTGHLDLLRSAAVYRQMKRWLRAGR